MRVLLLMITFTSLSIINAPRNPLQTHTFQSKVNTSKVDEAKQADYPLTLFFHGLGATYEHAHLYQRFFCSPWYSTFNFPDAPEGLFKKNAHTGIAQTTEISYGAKALSCIDDDSAQFLQQDTQITDTPEVVLYGISRGASVIINILGQQVYQPAHVQIKALILESPFASVQDCIESFSMPRLTKFFVKRFFKEFNSIKNRPIEAVNFLSPDIPILFICTKNDTVIPCQSTISLYSHLADDLNRDNVYLYCADGGVHANISNSLCGMEYLTVVHAFYKRCGLSHDPELAAAGAERFACC